MTQRPESAHSPNTPSVEDVAEGYEIEMIYLEQTRDPNELLQAQQRDTNQESFFLITKEGMDKLVEAKLSYEPLLEAAGLRVEPLMQPIAEAIEDSEVEGLKRRGQDEFVPRITDVHAYAAFLKQSERLLDEDGDPYTDVVVDTVDAMHATISASFDLVLRGQVTAEDAERLDEVADKTLRDFSAISFVYEETGLDDKKHYEDTDNAYERMQKMITFWGHGQLAEYAVADRYQLVSRPEDQDIYGPANWHISDMRSMWGEALGFLDGLREEGKAETVDVVKHGLLHSLDHAIGVMNDNTDPEAQLSSTFDLVGLKNIRTILLKDLDIEKAPDFDMDLYEAYINHAEEE